MQNILLVTVDSLRADHVGYHGYERNTTPNLDEIAQNGSTFTEAYAHAGGTRFAFPSILTGVYPTMHGGYKQITDDQTLISEVFQDAGYQTGGFHSNLWLSADFGFDRGWDEFFDSKDEGSAATKLRSKVKKVLEGTPLYSVAQDVYNLIESTSGINVGSYLLPADETTDRALAWIDQLEGHAPVFLWVHYMDPHHPFLPPEEYQLLFRDEPISKRRSVRLREKLTQHPEDVTDEELQLQLDLYDAEIRFNDEHVARLAEGIQNKLGDTTVAFTADHGEHFLERGYFSGARFYEFKQHVPLMIKGPAWNEDGEYDDLVGLVDLPSTLVEHADLDIPDNYYGHPLQMLVRGDEWPRSEIIGGVGEDPITYGCRTKSWNYIQRPDEEELYSLEADPEESNNVVGEHPDVASDLRFRIARHRKLVRRTDEKIEAEEMDDQVENRLKRLGYLQND